ncbi:helix-turn-helix domain-containing protein [Chitinophaga sp. MM2321]|uniref:helix-turn-helix domain-containing protein n=1 Tax=Chitinophaga sp. MM2321 TaxID=3137178 RepID=UPI0032D57149
MNNKGSLPTAIPFNQMIYRIFSPVTILADVVEHYWYAKAEMTGAAIQHYATPLLQGLTFNFKKQQEQHAYGGEILQLDKQVYLFGQPVGYREGTTNEKGIDIIGVKFKPLGISKITGINMEYIANRIIAAEDIWGNELELLCDEMQSAPSLEKTLSVLEKFLIDKYTCTSLHYRVDNVQNAVSLITNSKGSMSIKDLQNQTNTSRKTLERAFLSYLGIAPKLYSRIVRFNAVKEMIDRNETKNLTSLALDFGFYDNSHFAAEFKYFSGFKPTAYRTLNDK